MPPDLLGGPLTTFIGVLAALSLSIYLAIEYIFPMARKAMNSNRVSAEERAAELVDSYLREELELDRVKRDASLRAPQIRMLRVGLSPVETTCLFINDGGIASELDVTPIGPFSATSYPREALKSGETGRIVIRDAYTSLLLMQFRLSYIDPYGQRIGRLYAYSERESRFKEI
jgi:hypothetical protein